jgi:uncharacterized protein
MKPRINMITLGVTEMERAIRFYEKGLGLQRMPFEGSAAFFILNGSWLSLYLNNSLVLTRPKICQAA